MASAVAEKESCQDGPEVCPALEVLPDVKSASSSSNQYYSARTQWMIDNRDKFSNRVDFEIECSKVHRTSVRESEGSACSGNEEEDEEILKANREAIAELRGNRVWSWRFQEKRDEIYEIGEQIGEGGEATIYAGIRTDVPEGGRGRHVVFKVFGRGWRLEDFVKQWPETSSRSFNGYYLDGWATSIEHVMLMPSDGRVAMVMRREWGDLRRLIDMKKIGNNNQGPPFDIIATLKLIYQIANVMVRLHDTNVVHRDLKASNVLLRASKDNRVAWESNVANIELPLLGELGDLPKVSDFECALAMMGTGFWRAPEVLEGIRDPIKRRSPTTLFTKESDVYSFGMLCYEIATGFLPFEREGFKGAGTLEERNLVISGRRPTFPNDVDGRVQDLILSCWEHDKSARPEFRDIQKELAMGVQGESFGKCSKKILPCQKEPAMGVQGQSSENCTKETRSCWLL